MTVCDSVSVYVSARDGKRPKGPASALLNGESTEQSSDRKNSRVRDRWNDLMHWGSGNTTARWMVPVNTSKGGA